MLWKTYLSYVGGALIGRATAFINDIRVKYFRAFDFIAEVVRNFFAGVCLFGYSIVCLKNMYVLGIVMSSCRLKLF